MWGEPAHARTHARTHACAQYIVNPNSRLLEEHAKQIQAHVAKRLVRFKPECLNYTPRVWEVRVFSSLLRRFACTLFPPLFPQPE
eukprot:COSAG01_NODE_9970_length_2288_cov_11.761207_3_plen_85_part_00